MIDLNGCNIKYLSIMINGGGPQNGDQALRLIYG